MASDLFLMKVFYRIEDFIPRKISSELYLLMNAVLMLPSDASPAGGRRGSVDGLSPLLVATWVLGDSQAAS